MHIDLTHKEDPYHHVHIGRLLHTRTRCITTFLAVNYCSLECESGTPVYAHQENAAPCHAMIPVQRRYTRFVSTCSQLRKYCTKTIRPISEQRRPQVVESRLALCRPQPNLCSALCHCSPDSFSSWPFEYRRPRLRRAS